MVSHKHEDPAEQRRPWDVAISFPSDQEPLAVELRDALGPAISTFVYSKAQEHLAGRDGTEVFRNVFRSLCSLVVVLYAKPWGQTPWTRVEETAIKELCLQEGWQHLLFVRVKGGEPIPNWVPEPHLYLDFETFAMRDLVGAIKLKLRELGVDVRPATPSERAAAQRQRREYDEETLDLLRSIPANHFNKAGQSLIEAVQAEATKAAKSGRWSLSMGPGATVDGFVVSAEGCSIQLISMRKHRNTTEDAYFELREFESPLPIQHADSRVRYSHRNPPQPSRARRVPIRRVPSLGWCWELDGQVLPPEAAATTIIHALIYRIEADNVPQPGTKLNSDDDDEEYEYEQS